MMPYSLLLLLVKQILIDLKFLNMRHKTLNIHCNLLTFILFFFRILPAVLFFTPIKMNNHNVLFYYY